MNNQWIIVEWPMFRARSHRFRVYENGQRQRHWLAYEEGVSWFCFDFQWAGA